MISRRFLLITMAALLLGPLPAFPRPVTAGDVKALIDREYFTVAHSAMAQAKKSILCAMYMAQLSVNHPFGAESLLLRDLISANNRGVDVRVILEGDPEKNNKYAYNFLKDAGVNVIYDPKDVTTHSRFIIIDDEFTIVGSHNWTFGGQRVNHEASVLIRSKNVARAFRKAFEQIAESKKGAKQ